MSVDEPSIESDAPYPLDWETVDRIAKSAFSIWVGQPELAWAKKAFGYLPGHGLSATNDAFNQTVAVFRFLVLGGIYNDFCEAAWDMTSYISYAEWCEPPDIIDRFVVGQLFARLPDWEPDDEVDYSDALDQLVEEERGVVVAALLKGFGGVSGLYASLWRSAPTSSGEDSDGQREDDESDDYDCFEADDVGKLKAYEWVSEGCPRRPEE